MSSSITVTDINGQVKEIELVSGLTLMELLRDAGYEEILAMCGGGCSCATCHVHIDQLDGLTLAPIEEDEEMLLEMADNYHAKKSRLSCQIELQEPHAGMHVTILEPE